MMYKSFVETADTNAPFVAGRIIGENRLAGEYCADIEGQYVAYRLGDGKARRYEGSLEQFENLVARKHYDVITEAFFESVEW